MSLKAYKIMPNAKTDLTISYYHLCSYIITYNLRIEVVHNLFNASKSNARPKGT